MKMCRSAAAALALALLSVTPALADSGPYVQVFGRPNFLPPGLDFESDVGDIEPDYESGYNVGGALGYRINEFFRIEGEVSYQHHDVGRGDATGLAQLISDVDGSAEILSGMLNAYIEGYFGFPWQPFRGLGGGVAQVS